MHYFNYHPKYDRWIEYGNSNEMAIIGSRTKAYGIGKSRKNVKKDATLMAETVKSKHLLTLEILEIKKRKMLEELSNNDYVMIDVGGDGNCLFRSVSHQLYGKGALMQGLRTSTRRYEPYA